MAQVLARWTPLLFPFSLAVNSTHAHRCRLRLGATLAIVCAPNPYLASNEDISQTYQLFHSSAELRQLLPVRSSFMPLEVVLDSEMMFISLNMIEYGQ